MSAATAVRDLTSYYLPGRARSPSPSDSDGRPVSPIEGMKKSPSSSTVESISYECPKLPAVVCVRQCELRKGSAGWGFTLKGTTCELCEGQKVYHCHVESVHEKGAAKVRRVGVAEVPLECTLCSPPLGGWPCSRRSGK